MMWWYSAATLVPADTIPLDSLNPNVSSMFATLADTTTLCVSNSVQLPRTFLGCRKEDLVDDVDDCLHAQGQGHAGWSAQSPRACYTCKAACIAYKLVTVCTTWLGDKHGPDTREACPAKSLPPQFCLHGTSAL